jgi:hypothetical protein
VNAGFIAPMLLQRTSTPPEGDAWRYEIKWDGYRAIAYKTSGKVGLRSRNDNDFSSRYAGVTAALAKLPDDTVLDGEIVALDEKGNLIRTGKENEFFNVAVQQLADEGVRVGFTRTADLPWAEIDDPGDLAFARLYVFPKLTSRVAA